MLGSKWNRWLLIGGAALGALAVGCSSEDDGGGTPPPVTATDGGLDSGTPSGADASACTTLFGITGVACTLDDGGFGYRTCVNGVPGTGPCMSPLNAIPDGGFAFDA